MACAEQVEVIKRRTLLYRTNVEYGSWTINHIVGCKHGCRYPCYAYMLSKRFGRVKDYEDWRNPRIISNTLELLDNEIIRHKDLLDFVHLSFMTDPFMYDMDSNDLIPEIKNLTLKIIERLNRANVRVTCLTKGFYPDETLEKDFLVDNEYGISLVSMSEKFKRRFEEFSAPFKKRIDSLKRLSNANLKTWVSIEPYPTPNLDDTSDNIENLLDNIAFVDKIVFGKWNYNIEASKFPNNESFYKKIAESVIKFCETNNIKYHIKQGTPYSEEKTKEIFKSDKPRVNLIRKEERLYT
ncbi:TPA: radical SAM protein [bacterium]|nr:radical SAM protein [bacterium]